MKPNDEAVQDGLDPCPTRDSGGRQLEHRAAVVGSALSGCPVKRSRCIGDQLACMLVSMVVLALFLALAAPSIAQGKHPMDQPYPSVTDGDVMRIVYRDFAPKDIPAISAILNEYGALGWEREATRVRLAVLKLASGSLERARAQVKVAKRDYRDVISAAEAYSSKALGIDALAPQEKERIFAEDWKQYEEWLKR